MYVVCGKEGQKEKKRDTELGSLTFRGNESLFYPPFPPFDIFDETRNYLHLTIAAVITLTRRPICF